MHTVPILILISIPLFLIDSKFSLGFAFGYIMHLIADTLTPMGIMLLYPYKKRHYSLAKRFNFKIPESLLVGICSIFLFIINFKIILYSYLTYGVLKVSKRFI